MEAYEAFLILFFFYLIIKFTIKFLIDLVRGKRTGKTAVSNASPRVYMLGGNYPLFICGKEE